jgi:hypothetical protein
MGCCLCCPSKEEYEAAMIARKNKGQQPKKILNESVIDDRATKKGVIDLEA